MRRSRSRFRASRILVRRRSRPRMQGSSRNGPLEAGLTALPLLRFAAPSTGDPGSRRGPLGYARDLAPACCRFRSTRFLPRSTGRLVDPPASPRVPGSRHPRNGARHGRSSRGRGIRAELSGREVKRRLAGASQVERRSEEPPPRMRKPAMMLRNGGRMCRGRRRGGRVLRNFPVFESRRPTLRATGRGGAWTGRSRGCIS